MRPPPSRRPGGTPLAVATILALGSAAIAGAPEATAPRATYKFDAKTSRLTVETETIGLSSLFGHDHRFDVRDFTGTITLLPAVPESASLELEARGDGLLLVEDVSDDTHREISAALRDVVLETGKYPLITFRSRGVTAQKQNDDGSVDVKLAGELTLHGVRRKIVVPARVTTRPDGLRATGALELRQSEFKIKPFTFARGTVKVRDVVALSFDLVARP